MKNILLLNPPHLQKIVYMKEIGRCGRKSIAGEYWPQIGLAYLAAIVREKGYNPYFWDGMLPKRGIESLSIFIRNIKPSLVIMITSTPTFENDIKIAKEIKNISNELHKDIKIAMVGTHSSVFPKETLETDVIDIVFINEAEKTLSDFLDIFSEDCHIKAIEKNIKSIAFKNNDSFYINTEPNFIENLDKLPFPARDLMDNDKYTMPFFGNEPFTNIIPSRGCPYNCIFCRAGKVWGKKIRLRSVDNVLSEIKEVLNKYSISNFIFMTDSFTFNKKWVLEFCTKILEEKIKIKWICNSRVDAVDFEMLLAMKKAGCILISYGIESGNEEILIKSKKNITLKQAENAIYLTKKAGILSFAYFIFGLPGETEETIKETIKFARQLKADYVNFHIATPFPGTEFYEYAKTKNLLISDKWIDFEEEGSCVISYPYLNADRLIYWQKKAMKNFYFTPKKILSEITKIKSPSDLKNKIKAAVKLFKLM